MSLALFLGTGELTQEQCLINYLCSLAYIVSMGNLLHYTFFCAYFKIFHLFYYFVLWLLLFDLFLGRTSLRSLGYVILYSLILVRGNHRASAYQVLDDESQPHDQPHPWLNPISFAQSVWSPFVYDSRIQRLWRIPKRTQGSSFVL